MLFTAVGFPKRPTSTGKGGLLRGSPRRPSIDSKSAVSSPQTYAPAPRRISMSNEKPLPRMSSPEEPGGPRLLDRAADPLGAERVLRAQVEEAALGVRREPLDRHRLDDGERVLLHEHPVLERPRLRLVRVAHDVVRAGGLRRDGGPLAPGRERGAAAAEESRGADLLDDGGPADRERAAEGLVPAGGDVVGEARRVDPADAAEELEPVGRPPAGAERRRCSSRSGLGAVECASGRIGRPATASSSRATTSSALAGASASTSGSSPATW